MIEQAEALGEPFEDSLLLFSMLYGIWAANYIAFNGDVMRELATQFLALAEKQAGMVPVMIGHRLMGISLMCTGDIAESRAHYDRAIALYSPTEHRSLAMRFGQDVRVALLCYRSMALWMLGFPEGALADMERALKDAREIGHAATLMYALFHATLPVVWCGNYATTNTIVDELDALAEERGASFWKIQGMRARGQLLSLSHRATEAIQITTSALTAWRSTGSSAFEQFYLAYLAKTYAELDQFDDAWRCIREAMTAVETTKERWWEAEVNRIAGEIALLSPDPDAATAEAYFEQALAVARQQQAKSLELRASTSLARLWRDQGKVQEAHDLLAPVYGWFTEGFDTRNLKEAKALLEELA